MDRVQDAGEAVVYLHVSFGKIVWDGDKDVRLSAHSQHPVAIGYR